MSKKTITIIVSVTAFVFFAIVNPYNQRKDAEISIKRAELGKQAIQDNLFSGCLDDATAYYKSNWELACNVRELEKNCDLPSGIANSLMSELNDQKEICVKLYK